ncbi:hypothetical protein ABPG77_001846 [Micractinium sp. CCAP 211/92]
MQHTQCSVAGRALAPAGQHPFRAQQQRRQHVRQLTRCEVAKPGGGARFEDDGAHGSGAPPIDITSLEFPAPSNAAAAAAAQQQQQDGPIRTSGLHRTPLSGGVQNATLRCDLPSPAVAVRNLVEQAQFAHLCTLMCNMHHRRAGYPFGSLVDFAADGAGHPIFSLSPLAIQTRNLLEDPRCSVVVQMPGWTGLANARVTIFGEVYKLPESLQEQAQEIFHAKHATRANRAERYVSGNAVHFRMNRILDIYFVGGFGTVQWVDVAEYSRAQPDPIVLDNPNRVLQVLNESFSAPLRDLLSRRDHPPADDAAFISIDGRGADVRVRKGGEYSVERIGFDKGVNTLEDAVEAMSHILNGDPRQVQLSKKNG